MEDTEISSHLNLYGKLESRGLSLIIASAPGYSTAGFLIPHFSFSVSLSGAPDKGTGGTLRKHKSVKVPPAKGTKKLKGTLFFAGFLREKFDISRIPLYCSKLRFIAGIVRDHEKRGELFSWWNSVAISPWHRRTGSESDTAIPRSKQSVFFSSFRHFRHAPCSRPPQRRFFPALRQTLHTYMARPWQSNNKGGIAHA